MEKYLIVGCPAFIYLERTLALIKPDAVNKEKEIIDVILNNGFTIAQRRNVHMSPEQASDFYKPHYGKIFFPALVAYMSSAPIIALMLFKNDAISAWKHLIGPANPTQAHETHPGCLRATYGTDQTRNALHASDNREAAEKELKFFFSEDITEPIPRGVNATTYLAKEVQPTLFKGLTALAKRKPRDPVVPHLRMFAMNLGGGRAGEVNRCDSNVRAPDLRRPVNISEELYEDKAAEYLQRLFVPALQSGLSVWMQIIVFVQISVVHFNPAVSMGFLVAGHLKMIMFIPYVITQCLSSIAAAYIAKVIFGKNPSIIVVPDDANGIAVFLNEAIMTGTLIFFAVAMVMDESYTQPTGPLAIGFTVFQGILSARWVGVACISPSRAFGPAVVTGGPAWNRHWLFWVSDLTGAAFAASYYMLFFAPKEKRWLIKMRKKMEKQEPAVLDEEESKDGLISETNI